MTQQFLSLQQDTPETERETIKKYIQRISPDAFGKHPPINIKFSQSYPSNFYMAGIENILP
ncbi:hypothetical protein PAAG_07635 [Paracoccidioides lutzii Pb01]|uniref:Uncharacterized protein n=1 Tax=Paracoccidioides lutzii (strain ATCC MYA-826 / Pb01) TaxID=502779 RepID=C1HAI1_PARBA|nr:hypothetical protein PAAG_07635 [Paracoccidioides lutzii Pb01]EEH37353.2 hypothetical protein PAAG_07635 [Paracoccidioides lutzii Pb01]